MSILFDGFRVICLYLNKIKSRLHYGVFRIEIYIKIRLEAIRYSCSERPQETGKLLIVYLFIAP